MSEVNVFELATRLSKRFKTTRGTVTVEDLWNMPLQGNEGFCLDAVYMDLNKIITEQSSSRFAKDGPMKEDAKIKLSIVDHIIDYKLEEKAKEKRKADNKARREEIMELMKDKQNEKDKSLSMTKLKKMLDELEEE